MKYPPIFSMPSHSPPRHNLFIILFSHIEYFLNLTLFSEFDCNSNITEAILKTASKMCESVKVIVRCRPMNEKEQRMRCRVRSLSYKFYKCDSKRWYHFFQDIVRIEECKVYLENPQDSKAPEKSFVFDNAYDSNATNETIYSEICYSLVEVSFNDQDKPSI